MSKRTQKAKPPNRRGSRSYPADADGHGSRQKEHKRGEVGRLVGRSCTICRHGEHHAVNIALVAREPYRDIALRYGVSKDALKRHSQEHIPKLLSQASRAVEVAEADSLLDRVEGLYKRTEKILDTVEESEEWGLALAAIRECRSNLELLGRVTKELEAAPTFNLHLNPEWVEVRTILVTTLEAYPEARQAVADALAQIEEGNGQGY